MRPDGFTALPDANVLYPAATRNLLLRIASKGAYRARWTAQIQEEWIEALLRNRPDLERRKLDRTRMLMNTNVPDCLVEGYEDLIGALTLPDPNDRHVLAAAIVAGGDVIVTNNLSDFPAEKLGPYGLEAQLPDTFVTYLFGLHGGFVVAAAKEHRSSLKNPPRSVDDYLETLEQQGLVGSAKLLREYCDVI